ncbi:hypothetical protein NC796_14155 [Aliifodinibius sp. S!AR15-10]|nr:hypothetical protein [Aliifodinibius sp. S!AR15-10]
MDLLGALYPETIGELAGGPSPAMPSSLVSTINELIFFVGNANHNLSTDLMGTLVAMLLAFLPIYVGGALVGFVRRGGEDLLWIRMEKKLWKWHFEDEQVNKIDKTDSETTTEVSVPEKKLAVVNAQHKIQQKPTVLEKEQKQLGQGFTEEPCPSPETVDSVAKGSDEMDLDIQVEHDIKEFDEYSDDEVPKPENEKLETERSEPREYEEFGDGGLEAKESERDFTEENDSEDGLLEEEHDSECRVENELGKELSEAEESTSDEGEEEESEIQNDYSLKEYLQLARS